MNVWKELCFAAAFCVGLLMAIVPAEAALVSHYTMDGVGTDALGVQDGVLNGGPPTVAGKIGTAISFNAGVVQGSRTQNMSVADPGNGAHVPNDITVSAWVNTTDGGGFRGLVDKINGGVGILLDINGGNARLVSGATAVPSLAPVNNGAWHLVTGTFSAGIASLYVDGIPQGSLAGSYTGNPATAMNIAGDIPVTSTWALDGVVDDVGLWNNGLTAAEARALYSLADTAALNYHLGYAEQLFAIQRAYAGSTTIGGLNWKASGSLGGNLGEVAESGGVYTLRLDDLGNGLTTGVASPTNPPVPPTPPAGVLQAHWKLDDATGTVATDSVGGYDGTLGGTSVVHTGTTFDYSAPTWTGGKIGGGLSLAGGPYNPANGLAGDAVVVSLGEVELQDADISVALWARTTQNANYVAPVSRGWGHNVGDPGGWEFDTRTNSGVAAQMMTDSAVATWFKTGDTRIDDGQWHSIVLTYWSEEQELKCYVDGNDALTGTGSMGLTIKDIIFGGDAYSSVSYVGDLDDIGYWAGTLTEGQAKSLSGLGNSTLNYDLGEAQQLWDLLAAGTGSVDIGGVTWYATDGLSGGLGVVVESAGQYSLQLAADGSGVTTVPEPSTIVLLVLLGLMGVLRFRR